MYASRYVKRSITFAERRVLMNRMGHCEPDVALGPDWDIRGEENIFIGKDVYVGPRVLMIADKEAEIHIGDKVMLGPGVKLIASDHRFDDPSRPIKDSGYGVLADIQIGSDVWIGSAAIVLKGVHIGDGSVIGAGSVVTHSVGTCEIWAGNPARKIKDRFAVSLMSARR
jgi:maltose O-acetyltransferase